ncbi:MAG: four helix bundle protein [Oscillospiraceae bacterium]|nr:four helix bundle protein [Oscillospiraceae bacterium]
MTSPLLEKSKQFALEIIKVCNEIKREKRESVLTNQLIRSGTGIGANIREAFYAHSRADFIAKLQISLKECSESEYWLELLIESGYYDSREILEQCIEVKKLLIASINTAKSKAKQKTRQALTKACRFLLIHYYLFTVFLSRRVPSQSLLFFTLSSAQARGSLFFPRILRYIQASPKVPVLCEVCICSNYLSFCRLRD